MTFREIMKTISAPPAFTVVCGSGILAIAAVGIAAAVFGVDYPIWHQFFAGLVGVAIGVWLEVSLFTDEVE